MLRALRYISVALLTLFLGGQSPTTGKYITSETFLFDSIKENERLATEEVKLNREAVKNLKQVAFDIDVFLASINRR